MSAFNSPLIWENSSHLTASSLPFPAKWRMTNNWKNYILMRCRYPDLGSVSNWPKQIFLAIRPIGSNSQLWVVTRNQYGISALVPQTSFRWKTKGSFTKCQLYSQATVFRCWDCTVIKLLFTGKSMPKEIKAHSPLVHRTTQRLRMDYDIIRFLTGNWRETACIMIASGNETCSRTVNAT